MATTKRFDPSVLFETSARWQPRNAQPYPTFEAELDAVASGKKPMSMYSWTRDYLATKEFRRDAKQVLDCGLTLTLDPERPIPAPQWLQAVTAFVVRRDQMWRIPAFRALWETAFEGGRWSDSAEAQMSLLLGYTKAQRTAWLARLRWQQAEWGCATLYALVTSDQRAQIVALGQKCFGLDAALTVFRHTDLHLMKRNAARLTPKGLTIARAGVDRTVAWKILGKPARKPRSPIASAIVTTQLKALNAALHSRIELLGPKGWR